MSRALVAAACFLLAAVILGAGLAYGRSGYHGSSDKDVPWVDFTDYDGKCDNSTGSGATNATALTDAIAALPDGGTILFPIGVCKLDPVTISQAGIALVGQGWNASFSNEGTTIRCTSLNATCITVSADHVVIEGFSLKTDGSATAGQVLVAADSNGDRLWIRNLLLTSGQYTKGFSLNGSDGVEIEGVWAFNSVADGVFVHAVDTIETRITRSYVNNTAAVTTAIVDIESSAGTPDTIVLEGVTIAQGGGDARALWVHGGSGNTMPRWLMVTDSSFENVSSGALPAVEIDTGRSLMFTDSMVVGGVNAVKIDGGTDIRFENATIGNSKEDAINHTADAPTTLVNVVVSDASQGTTNTDSGILLAAGSRNFTMIGGHASGDRILSGGANQRHGIEVVAGADKYRFSNVECTGNATSCSTGLAGAASQVALTDAVTFFGVAHASLPAATNGTVLYCTDCTGANPCASGGSGAFARRENGAWNCGAASAGTATALAANGTNCAAGSAAGGVDASGNAETCIDHGGLGGLTDDDHTQYFLLAGRPGGTTATGGTASGNDLTLRGNSAAADGDIIMSDRLELWDDAPDVSTGMQQAARWDDTIDITADGDQYGIYLAPTLTCSSATQACFFGGLQLSGTLTQTGAGEPLIGDFSSAVRSEMTIEATSTNPIPNMWLFYDSNTFRNATASNQSLPSFGGIITTISDPLFTTTSTGNLTNPLLVGFDAKGRITAAASTTVTLTDRMGLRVRALTTSGAGTKAVTNEYGVHIGALANGSTIIAGVHSEVAAGTGKYNFDITGSAQSRHAGNWLAGSGSTTPNVDMDVVGGLATRRTDNSTTCTSCTSANIDATEKTFIKITGAAGGARTLHGIGGGVDGQHLVLYNADTQNLTVSNDSATEGTAANRILSLGSCATTGTGALTFIYDSGASRWICVAVNA